MECELPDFPRGSIVKMFVAINGVEFFPCPGELVVFQSPRITELVPSWISVTTKIDLKLRGINFTTQNLANTVVQVSLARGKVKKTVQGSCVDGEILCTIPNELLSQYSGASSRVSGSVSTTTPAASTEPTSSSPLETPRTQQKKDRSVESLILTPPIMVDVWLGGVHKTVPDAHRSRRKSC